MTIAQDGPWTRRTDRARREALRPLAHEATKALGAAFFALECARDALVGP